MQTEPGFRGGRAEARRACAEALLCFVVANIALMGADAYGYILAAGGAPWSSAWLFAHLALLAQLAVAGLLVGLVLLLLCRLWDGYRWVAILAPLAATVMNVFVYLDRSVFAFYRFHLGGLELHAIAMPGGLAALRVEPSDPRVCAAGAGLLFVVELLAFRLLSARAARRAPALAPVRRRWVAFAGITIALAATDHVVYAACDLVDARDVMRGARLVPFYQPFTLERFAHRHESAAKVWEAARGTGLPHYPRAALRLARAGWRPNIVWIVLDSWRADALTPENTPRLWDLGERSQVFLDHLSGGNSTQFGTFSMFYGLYAAAEPSFAAERRGPVLFTALRDLGYRFEVLSSLSLAVSNFRRTVFVDVQDAIADELPGPRARDKDRQITERFEAFLAARTDERPFFTVALMQSTHSGYDFDEATAAYRPYAAWVGFRGLGEGERRLRVYNRYRNAVHYADSLVGTMLDALVRRGLLDDTIVLVTGDHGEEFNEHGYWGHNGAFTPEQVHVPLVLHLPGMPAGRHAGLTSHHDLPATLLGLLGVTNPPSDYALGRSLLAGDGDPYAIACGADECALIDQVETVTFGIGAHDPAGIRVLDQDYRPMHASEPGLEKRSMQLLALLARESAFLK